VLTIEEIEAIGRDALVKRRHESPLAVVAGVVAGLPGFVIPGVLVWWTLLGVPAFFATRWAARQRLERDAARAHGVSLTTYRAIGDAYVRAAAERRGDFTEVARALQGGSDATRLLP
jgi:hypothetical protein